MGIVRELLQNTALPKMIKVRQNFNTTQLNNIDEVLTAGLRRADIAERVKKDMRIAIAVGSRGMAELPLIVKSVVSELKQQGAKPFIVPAMGSHGGATAEGQRQVLANLGITESNMDCAIISSMEVVQLGALDNGLPVLLDKAAYEADGIVVINRIKAHTGFSGLHESGLVKMITIGLGKQKGADSCHAMGYKEMSVNIVKMARIGVKKAPFLFGIGTIENAYDKIMKIAVIPAENIIEEEKALLAEAKAAMPKILLQPIDILLVDKIGKEFSGSGMDPNITGRAATDYFIANVEPPARLVVFDITDKSEGNATGMGMADITTRRLFDKIDFNYTYANVLTATAIRAARVPLIMESDKLAVQAAVKTCNIPDFERIRMVRIANTLHIEEMYISEAMLSEAERNESITVLGQPDVFVFDENGNMQDIGKWS